MNINFVFIDLVLGVLLFLAVIFDQRERRIPNVLILAGLILGVVFNTYTEGFTGLIISLKGLAAGLALLFIPFVMRGIGAGDVKLLGMVGTFKGALFAFHTFIYMALWGGLIAVILLIIKGQMGKTLCRLWESAKLALFKIQNIQDSVKEVNSGVFFPYALAIALGVVSAYFIKW